MSRRTIPQRVEVHCDRCGMLVPTINKGGRLVLADRYATSEFDLCDTCHHWFDHELAKTMHATIVNKESER